MICLVAQPLLESAPDRVEANDLNLTALAWNLTVLDPPAQEKMLVKIGDLLKCHEGMEMFSTL